MSAPAATKHVSQSFPLLDWPFVGKDVLPHPEALLTRLAERLELEYSAEAREYGTGDGPMCMALFRRRGGVARRR